MRLQIVLILDRLGHLGATCLWAICRNHAVSPRKESEKTRNVHLINIVLLPLLTTKTKEEVVGSFLHCAERIDTVPSRVQDVLASAGFSASCAAAPSPFHSGSPTPLPKRARHRRASEPARGSVARELSGILLALCERSGAQPPSAACRFSLTPWDSLVPRLQLLLQPVVVVLVTLGL